MIHRKEATLNVTPTISTKKGHRLASVTFFRADTCVYPPRFALPPGAAGGRPPDPLP